MPATTVFLLIAALLLSLALAWFQYFFRSGKNWSRNLIFATLRVITLFSVFVLLINPKITSTEYTLKKPDLLLAVDNSSSIEELGGAEQVRSLVSELSADNQLQEKFNIQIFTFGKSLEQGGELTFEESQTDLPQVFKSLGSLYEDKTAPLVLITDGNQTVGEEFTFAAQKFRQPVLPVVTGDTTPYQDISISRVNVNKYAFLNNRFPVEVIVNYSGNTTEETQLEITQGNSVIFQRNLSFSSENNSEVIRAEISANKIGSHVYRIYINPLEAEKNVLNNSREFAVEVIDERTKVLVAYSFLHPDLGTFKKSIESNRQREVDLKHISEVTELNDYQLVIMYQPDNRFESLVSNLKSENRNFFIVSGPKTDWRFLNQAQGIVSQELTYQSEEFFPVWNENFKAFQTEDIQYSGLPPLEGNFGNLDYATGMDILLYRQVQGVQLDQPLLAFTEADGSKTGFLFGAEIWRWRNSVFRETGSFQKFDDLIGKLVQFLASGRRKERLLISYEPLYRGSEDVIVRAEYFDQNYNFDPRASLELVISEEDKEPRRIPFILKENVYEVDLSSLAAGEYNFTVRVRGESVSGSGSFRIMDFDVEKQFAGANLDALQTIARNDKEGVFFPNEFSRLKKHLLSDDSYATVQKSHQKDVSLIDWKYLLGIIVLALSAEWFLRKYYGLI